MDLNHSKSNDQRRHLDGDDEWMDTVLLMTPKVSEAPNKKHSLEDGNANPSSASPSFKRLRLSPPPLLIPAYQPRRTVSHFSPILSLDNAMSSSSLCLPTLDRNDCQNIFRLNQRSTSVERPHSDHRLDPGDGLDPNDSLNSLSWPHPFSQQQQQPPPPLLRFELSAKTTIGDATAITSSDSGGVGIGCIRHRSVSYDDAPTHDHHHDYHDDDSSEEVDNEEEKDDHFSAASWNYYM